jgi:hypothetical protein
MAHLDMDIEPELELATMNPGCSPCSQYQNQNQNPHSKKEDCSACYKVPDKSTQVLETKNFHAFPSQNTFVFQSLTDKNSHEEQLRINAYSRYPNILNCDNKKQTIIMENKSNTKTNVVNTRKPLFI